MGTARALYLGPAFRLTPHRNATAVLAVTLAEKMQVADDPAAPNKTYRAARSVLIPPNTLHHLLISQGLMAFLYLDPLSRDFEAVNMRMNDRTPCASFDLTDESAKSSDRLRAVPAARPDRGARGALLGIGTATRQDQRTLIGAGRWNDPWQSHSLAELRSARRRISTLPFPACSGKNGNGRSAARLPIVGWDRAIVGASDRGRPAAASPVRLQHRLHDVFGMTPSALIGTLEPVARQ